MTDEIKLLTDNSNQNMPWLKYQCNITPHNHGNIDKWTVQYEMNMLKLENRKFVLPAVQGYIIDGSMKTEKRERGEKNWEFSHFIIFTVF